MPRPNSSGRRLHVHPAHRTIGVSSRLTPVRICDADSFEVPHDVFLALRVCLVCCSSAYSSNQALLLLEKYLHQRYHVDCSRTFPWRADDWAHSEILNTCDCTLLLHRPEAITGESRQHIRRLCHRGGALVGVRMGGRTPQDALEIDRDLFGADHQGHHANVRTEVEIVASAANHPILAGVEPFVSQAALERQVGFREDAVVLMRGTCDPLSEPVAWVRSHHGTRVFYTSLGDPQDFRCQSFLRLLANALFWTSRREPP